MRVYLAWGKGRQWLINSIVDGSLPRPSILRSFCTIDTAKRSIPFFDDFLLDSGAFTFLQKNDGSQNWHEYIERYANFISRANVEKFFELDIDSVVGYSTVKQFRARLEKLTYRQSIPVWHLSRGMDDFKSMCDEYPYVAIGGIASKEIRPEQYSCLTELIHEAHKRGTKIHGLGFTKTDLLPLYHFDSVDSSTWVTGNRFGHAFRFEDGVMKREQFRRGEKSTRELALQNYAEWMKFVEWARTHL